VSLTPCFCLMSPIKRVLLKTFLQPITPFMQLQARTILILCFTNSRKEYKKEIVAVRLIAGWVELPHMKLDLREFPAIKVSNQESMQRMFTARLSLRCLKLRSKRRYLWPKTLWASNLLMRGFKTSLLHPLGIQEIQQKSDIAVRRDKLANISPLIQQNVSRLSFRRHTLIRT
jgi:hypothetical protein